MRDLNLCQALYQKPGSFKMVPRRDIVIPNYQISWQNSSGGIDHDEWLSMTKVSIRTPVWTHLYEVSDTLTTSSHLSRFLSSSILCSKTSIMPPIFRNNHRRYSWWHNNMCDTWYKSTLMTYNKVSICRKEALLWGQFDLIYIHIS